MIKQAAIRFLGKLYLGWRYDECLQKLQEDNPGISENMVDDRFKGFIDESGNFLTRTEAVHYAARCNQIDVITFRLNPEDLWDEDGNPLRKRAEPELHDDVDDGDGASVGAAVAGAVLGAVLGSLLGGGSGDDDDKSDSFSGGGGDSGGGGASGDF